MNIFKLNEIQINKFLSITQDRLFNPTAQFIVSSNFHETLVVMDN